MLKKLLAAFIVAMLLASFAVIILQFKPSQSTLPKIGIFYYLWYNPDWSFSWDPGKIIDKPVFGYYDSSDPEIIKTQLSQMQDAGIDFVVISWWGFYDDYGRFIDNAAKQVFRVAESNSSCRLRFALMVEPFNKTGTSYDYEGIYSHIYSDFILPYSSIYYNESKPLLCFFNNETLTPNGKVPESEVFENIIVGQSDYAHWIYTDLNNYTQPKRNHYTDETSVSPRYDDSHTRAPSWVFDPNLTQGIWQSEWNKAIQLYQQGNITTIMISSWNEYPERTEIEPHYDATTSNSDPYLLLKQTKNLISQAKTSIQTSHPSLPTNLNPSPTPTSTPSASPT